MKGSICFCRDLCSPEILSSMDWWLVTDILGQTVSSVFKGQTVMLQQNPEITEPIIYTYTLFDYT